MSLKGSWPFTHFLAFFAGVIQWFLGLTVDHPGTMFCNMVFHIVCLSSGAIVTIFAFVWPFLLMLTFNMFFQSCFGTETLASTRGSLTYYWVSLLVSIPEVACKVRLSRLYNTTDMAKRTLPFNWWFLWYFRFIASGRESGFVDVEAGSSASWVSEEETWSPLGWSTGPLCRGPALLLIATALRWEESDLGDMIGKVCTMVSFSWFTAASTAGANFCLSNSSMTKSEALTIGPSSIFSFHL